MVTKITKKRVTEALEKQVAEKGAKHTYQKVRNTDHKRNVGTIYSYDDCIAGCVIRELAPDIHEQMLESERGMGSSYALEIAPRYIRDALQERFGAEALGILKTAQFKQDHGYTWGHAVKYATTGVFL